MCGTPNYIAPEVLSSKKGHSYEVDVWSLGVIIYTLLIGKPPFETKDVKSTYKRIKANNFEFPQHVNISDSAQSLICSLLQTEPKDRLTIDQIYKHEFLMTGGVPELLPVSTLACPPSKRFIKEYEGKPCRKLQERTDFVNIIPAIQSQLPKKPPSSEAGPAIWVRKWVDYSQKYGLGYVLSNGIYGVFLNDSTKIVLKKCGKKFIYIERGPDRKEINSCYSLNNYPEKLSKKVKLLGHFKNYLGTSIKSQQDKQSKQTKQTKSSQLEAGALSAAPTIYLKKWRREKHAILFRLSNKVVQVVFQDSSEILMSSKLKVVTYVNRKHKRVTYPLNSALESKDREMAKRLKYTKEILTYMLSGQQTRRSKSKDIHTARRSKKRTSSNKFTTNKKQSKGLSQCISRLTLLRHS